MTKAPRWDLSGLYSSTVDPKIAKDRKQAETLTLEFTKKYKGKINSKSLTAQKLNKALTMYEQINVLVYRIFQFAHLNHAISLNNQKVSSFYSETKEFSVDLSTKMAWFEIEWNALPKTKADQLIKDKHLSDYSHFLSRLRAVATHTLSEPEEILVRKKSLTGSRAFIDFYDRMRAGFAYELELKGKKQTMTSSEISSIASRHPNRSIRKRATEVIYKTNKETEFFHTFVLNNLLLDKKINEETRGFKFPQEQTLIKYDISKKTVDAMVNAVVNNVSIVERYYLAKARIVSADPLYEWDRYSNVYPKVEKKVSWAEAQETVLTAFSSIDPSFSKNAEQFFNNGWIDAEARKGKRAGAFCNGGTPKGNPYILMNYTGIPKNVSTLAHELGHGIHGVLASQENNFLELQPSTAIAEIASIFAESLTFDLLLENTKDRKTRANLLAQKIQGAFATIFRQTEFYLFESDIHTHRREHGELSAEDFNKYYQKRLQHMFGKGLILTEGHKRSWGPVLHFYKYSFYTFTYAFGELLTLALYDQYKKQGKPFVKRYIEALKAGGSKSPKDITKMLGVDIEDPQLWQQGLAVLQGYVDEFEELVQS